MINIENFTLVDLIFVSVILAIASVVVSISVVLVVMNRSILAIRGQFNVLISKQDNQIRILTSGSVGLGRKMIALEVKMRAITDTQEEMKVSDLEFSYTQAQRMIEQGLDSVKVADNSGLSSSEVQLMELLYNQNKKQVEPAGVI